MIQLRIRTEYSFGKTFAPIEKVIDRLKGLGTSHAAIVDGSTWGHVAWNNACIKAGIHPLFGVEIPICDEEEAPKSMWFLAKNQRGLSEMYRFNSKAYTQKVQTYKGSLPRLYRKDVMDMSDDIVVFAGSMLDGSFLKEVGAYIDLSPDSLVMTAKKRSIAEKNELKLVGISDNFYSDVHDKHVYQLATKSLGKSSPQHILGSLEYQDTALEIAEGCEGATIPVAPVLYVDGDLEKMCRDGIVKRGISWDDKYEARLNKELELILSKKFDSYFIIVSDMVKFAKTKMLVGPSRGSAAGSLVCYLTEITEIDPMRHGLFFERFITEDRTDLPDIDLDFPDIKRPLVFKYMADKYGIDNVAHIGTITKFKPKSALIHVAKQLGVPPSETAPVKAGMIVRRGADSRASACLKDTLETTDAGRILLDSYPQMIYSADLEDHASHTGVHAAGLIVCQDEITNYATVDDKDIAHIEKRAATQIGLLKIDVLGLRTLTVLEDSGIDVDWYKLSFDDSLVYDEIFNKRRFCGIFSFESDAMRSLCRQLTFKSLSDIDAATALVRPGPWGSGVTDIYIRRQDGEPYDVLHEKVADHMKDTYGVPVYQEQTLAIVREIGEFSWEDTHSVRAGISKSQGEEYFVPYLKQFIKGAKNKGLSEKDALKVWDTICTMGSWQMNKAHTRSYAVISYWTAWLKVHHPLAFAASSLRNSKGEEESILFLRELKREGINYVPFDLDKSRENWDVIDGTLYGGFTCLKGIGSITAKKLIKARDDGSLTKKQISSIKHAYNPYDNIFPFHTDYGDVYENPERYGIASKVYDISDIGYEGAVPHGQSRVFMGELLNKSQNDYNVDLKHVKRRKGVMLDGPTEYLNFRVRDDYAILGCRIRRYDFIKMGVTLMKLPNGTKLLIRAKFFNGIPWGFVTNWRILDEVVREATVESNKKASA